MGVRSIRAAENWLLDAGTHRRSYVGASGFVFDVRGPLLVGRGRGDGRGGDDDGGSMLPPGGFPHVRTPHLHHTSLLLSTKIGCCCVFVAFVVAVGRPITSLSMCRPLPATAGATQKLNAAELWGASTSWRRARPGHDATDDDDRNGGWWLLPHPNRRSLNWRHGMLQRAHQKCLTPFAWNSTWRSVGICSFTTCSVR